MRIKKPVLYRSDYPVLALVWLYRVAANTKIECLRFLLFGPVPKQVKTVLLFRTGSWGDSICALPAIVQVKKRYTNAQIDILTNAGASDRVSMSALLNHDWYRTIIHYQQYAIPELTRELRLRRYALVIELPQYDASLFQLVRNMIFFRFRARIKNGFGRQLDNVPFGAF